MIIVSKDGCGDFTSVNEAVKYTSANDTICIKKGIYRERVEITIPLTLKGEDSVGTIIEYGMYAKKRWAMKKRVLSAHDSVRYGICGKIPYPSELPDFVKIIDRNEADNILNGFPKAYCGTVEVL